MHFDKTADEDDVATESDAAAVDASAWATTEEWG
jgi:hypothetical protein